MCTLLVVLTSRVCPVALLNFFEVLTLRGFALQVFGLLVVLGCFQLSFDHSVVRPCYVLIHSLQILFFFDFKALVMPLTVLVFLFLDLVE